MSRSEQQFLKRSATGGSERAGPAPVVAGANLPVGPSVLFDDSGSIIIPVSQSQGAGSASQQRQRPRFANSQALDEALLQAIEGRITAKNAWASQDASNLLEGITHTIESTFDRESDEYAGFAKAATVVEGCSKVWTVRVDSTYQRSNQMVKQLLRNDNGGGANDDGNGENGDDEEAERRKELQRQRRPLARTLTLDVSEINLDPRSRVALMQTGVNAQFRAITEKFDQGHAQGLLLNNTPLGSTGNLILDVDYSHDNRSYSSKHRLSGRRSGDAAAAAGGRASGLTTDVDNTTLFDSVVEEDNACTTEFTFPPYEPFVAPPRRSDGSSSVSEAGVAGKADSAGEAGRPSANAVNPLLLIPRFEAPPAHGSSDAHAASVRTSGHSVWNEAEADGVEMGGGNNSALNGAKQEENTGGPNGVNNINGSSSSSYFDDGYDDTGDFGDDGNGDEVDFSGDDIDLSTAEGRQRLASEARDLAYGTSALEAMDTSFGFNRGLALENDEANEWFPLADSAPQPFGGLSSNSELQRLRKEHLLNGRGRGVAGLAAATASSVATALSGGMQQLGQQQGTNLLDSAKSDGRDAKRARKEKKSIVFDYSSVQVGMDGKLFFALPESTGVSSPTTGSGASDSLKQSTTEFKNVTPIGRDVLRCSDPNVVAVYTQSAVQLQKAEEHGLLLAAPLIPGKSIPSYCPETVNVEAFFQPFATKSANWNLLRKTVAVYPESGMHGGGPGALDARGDYRTTANGSGLQNNNEYINDDDDDDGMGDFPADFGADDNDDDDGNVGEDGLVGGERYRNFDGGVDGAEGADSGAALQFYLDNMPHGGDARDLAENGLMALTGGAGSGGGGAADWKDPLQFTHALQTPAGAAAPTQVDVVRLRAIMWSRLQEVMQHCEGEGALAGSNGTVGQKRTRDGKIVAQTQAQHSETDVSQEDGTVDARHATLRPQLSDIVYAMLPEVARISSNGTLSPAFFFFSILFLANEHGILLRSVQDLDDLIVLGMNDATTASAGKTSIAASVVAAATR